jgi:hypothetical protein
MRRKRLATAGASFLGILALAVLGSHFIRTSLSEMNGGTTASRLPELRKLVEQQERESAEATTAYTPKTTARLDDLTASAELVLRQLPGVVSVEVNVRAEKPANRIVHLRDWHFVPRDLYAIDLRNSAGRPLSDEEVDRLHEELCLEVEAVQLGQMALLRCLVKHHGPRRIFCEGLIAKDLPRTAPI